MKKIIITALISLLSYNQVALAKEFTIPEIITKSMESKKQSFSGKRIQNVVRSGGANSASFKLESKAEIDYVNEENSKIVIKSPAGIAGLNYFINTNRSTIFFPDENLAFTDAVPSSGNMVTDTIIGKVTYELALLQKNYAIEQKPDDEIASHPTYVIELKPLPQRNHDNGTWLVPGRKFWISKTTFQVLREDRTWGENIEPFFSSQFSDYKPMPFLNSPNVRVKLPYKIKKVPIGAKKEKVETFLETFKTIEATEKKLKEKLAVPNYLPNGFKLREVLVLNFYDTKIIMQKYDDGLNTMYVTYRTRPNFFLTLLAGNFSLNLLHKMSDLSYHAPYNYMSRETKDYLVISFGDLYPEDLKQVNESVALK